MKKVVVNSLIFLFVFSALVHFSLAATNSTKCGATDENCKIDDAYSCLSDKIKDCSQITSSDEKVFSLLSTGKCQSQVAADANYKTDIRYTSLALLGLDKYGGSISDAEEWLMSKNSSTTNLNWYLQVESSNATTCNVIYNGNTYANAVSVNSDKTVGVLGAGNCLSVSSNGLWLLVNPSCYGNDIGISCTNSFLTTLLYQKNNGDGPLYITETAHSSSSGGTTTENVHSLCFKKNSACDYEGTLWATLALDSKGQDVSAYLPYLVTSMSDASNEKYLPESFLLTLTGQFKTQLLALQKNSQYWSVSGDNYYDTALALLPLQYQDAPEKQNSKTWLLQSQGGDGCWNSGSVRDTGFLLYSIWPHGGSLVSGGGNGSSTDCEAAGNFCRSTLSCSNDKGNVINSLTCAGTLVCCDKQMQILTCTEQSGKICDSNQQCSGGTTSESSDTSLGQTCCIGGTCGAASSGSSTGTQSSCVQAGGTCAPTCGGGEKESTQSCDFSSDVCCVQSSGTSSGIGSLWIWVLIVLIILVIAAIIFRDKLRILWFRISSGKGSAPSPGNRPGPYSPSGFLPRRILPPLRSQVSRPGGELGDVLKKLKEMGK